MKKRKSIEDEVSRFRELENTEQSLESKLDELILLLEQSRLDSKTVTHLQSRINKAFDSKRLTHGDLKEFMKLDDQNMSRLDKADDLEVLLMKYKVDSNTPKKYAVASRWALVTRLIISLLLVALGFAMIIMPAPPYFEMFTIFYFTTDDGITLMDVISLLIIFTGVYLFFISITKLNR